MEIVIAGVVVALGLVVAAALVAKRTPAPGIANGQAKVPPVRAVPEAGETAARRAETTRIEERLHGREEALESRVAELAARERRLAEKESQIDEIREKAIRQLEQTSGLPASKAKALLMKELEDQVRHDSARRLRAIEEETKRDAERRVRNILSVVMQRLAAGHAA
jgi:ribonuclease Y